MQKIIPHLWYEDKAEEAARFYVSIFKNSKITGITHYGKTGEIVSGKPEGSVMTVSFELDGQKFVALNGGAPFKLSEAISFIVECKTQKEIDYYWKKLSSGGDKEAQICGWLKDKYGLSWQIVPSILEKMLASSDKGRLERVMEKFLRMKKINIADLEKAYKKRP